MAKVWTRPASAPYPGVYSRFTGRVPKDGGAPMRFRIQDVTEDMDQQVMDFMSEEFASDEPICKGLKIKSDEHAMEDLRQMWRHAMQARLALVCLLETGDGSISTDDGTPQGKPVIAGANITSLATKEEDKTDKKLSEAMEKLFYCFNMVSDMSGVYEKYGVDKIMTAYGLSVAKGFRGQNIGTELLKARIPLGKAVSLKVTGTMFSSAASQFLARRCGFVLLAEIPYREFKEVHNIDCGVMDGETMQYMAMELSNNKSLL